MIIDDLKISVARFDCGLAVAFKKVQDAVRVESEIYSEKIP